MLMTIDASVIPVMLALINANVIPVMLALINANVIPIMLALINANVVLVLVLLVPLKETIYASMARAHIIYISVLMVNGQGTLIARVTMEIMKCLMSEIFVWVIWGMNEI